MGVDRSASRLLAAVVAVLLGCGSSSAQPGGGGNASGAGPGTYPPLTFSAIGQAVLVSGQFYFTEGPVWDPGKNVLYFSDINAQQNGTTGGAVYRLTLPNTFDVLLRPEGTPNGLGLDPHRNLTPPGSCSATICPLPAPATLFPPP